MDDLLSDLACIVADLPLPLDHPGVIELVQDAIHGRVQATNAMTRAYEDAYVRGVLIRADRLRNEYP
jgi:hypothetical protein